ncbi:MAG: DUF7144 family membrane protein [Nocardioidaceae bacterium]
MSLTAGPRSSRESTFDVPGAYGWIGFATVMLILLGCFHAIQGLVAMLDDKTFLVPDSGLVVSVDYTVWGWVHLVGGIIVVFAGAALFTGRMWARIVGVLAAMASAIVNIAFLPAYPIIAATMIAFDILIIWAITVHGAEMKEA